MNYHNHVYNNSCYFFSRFQCICTCRENSKRTIGDHSLQAGVKMVFSLVCMCTKNRCAKVVWTQLNFVWFKWSSQPMPSTYYSYPICGILLCKYWTYFRVSSFKFVNGWCAGHVEHNKENGTKATTFQRRTHASQTSNLCSSNEPRERPPMLDISNKLHALVDEFVSNLSSKCDSLAHNVSAQAQAK